MMDSDQHMDERLYPCTKCKKKFVSFEFLITHESTRHSSARPYACIVCQETFKQLIHMLVHQRAHSGEYREDNNSCNEMTSKQLSVRLHSSTQSEVKSTTREKLAVPGRGSSKQQRDKVTHTGPDVCVNCNRQLKDDIERQKHECSYIKKHSQVNNELKELPNHWEINRGILPNQGRQCKNGQQISRSQEVEINRIKNNIKNSEKSFSCTKCKKKYMRAGHLRRHQLSHSGVRSYACTKCSKTFALPHQLKEHDVTHTDERPYECKSCDRTFRQLAHLITHTRAHTGERPYLCTVCDKTFRDSSCFRVHGLTHTGELLHKCMICSISFVTGQKLRRHELIHKGEYPYKCTFCDQQFRHKSSLLCHENTNHSRSVSYVCITCNQLFTNPANLWHHQKVHSIENTVVISHVCKICDIAFSKRSLLRRHSRKHAVKQSERVVKQCDICKTCTKSFRCGSHLRRHELIHNRERSYQCTKCEQRFVNETSQVMHERCHNRTDGSVPPDYTAVDRLIQTSFMSSSSTARWRWCVGVCVERIPASCTTGRFYICTDCHRLFTQR